MDMRKIMQQAQAMQAKIAELQARLEEENTEGSSGGGLVRVLLSGKGDMRRIAIDPSLLAPSEKEVLEDLIVAAFADAKSSVESNFNQQMASMAGELGLPPGMKMPF